jgi:hypothetical protein
MSLGTLKQYRTREQWELIKKAVYDSNYEQAASLCSKYEFYARDIARNMLRDINEGKNCPSAAELILLTERATYFRAI